MISYYWHGSSLFKNLINRLKKQFYKLRSDWRIKFSVTADLSTVQTRNLENNKHKVKLLAIVFDNNRYCFLNIKGNNKSRENIGKLLKT